MKGIAVLACALVVAGATGCASANGEDDSARSELTVTVSGSSGHEYASTYVGDARNAEILRAAIFDRFSHLWSKPVATVQMKIAIDGDVVSKAVEVGDDSEDLLRALPRGGADLAQTYGFLDAQAPSSAAEISPQALSEYAGTTGNCWIWEGFFSNSCWGACAVFESAGVCS